MFQLKQLIDASVFTADYIHRQSKVGHEEQLAQLPYSVELIYRTVITEHLPCILESIDISCIVFERFNEMDMDETERLIFQVMDKELKAIVWTGTALGAIMGYINLMTSKL